MSKVIRYISGPRLCWVILTVRARAWARGLIVRGRTTYQPIQPRFGSRGTFGMAFFVKYVLIPPTQRMLPCVCSRPFHYLVYVRIEPLRRTVRGFDAPYVATLSRAWRVMWWVSYVFYVRAAYIPRWIYVFIFEANILGGLPCCKLYCVEIHSLHFSTVALREWIAWTVWFRRVLYSLRNDRSRICVN